MRECPKGLRLGAYRPAGGGGRGESSRLGSAFKILYLAFPKRRREKVLTTGVAEEGLPDIAQTASQPQPC